ncbi:thiol-disulfide oxidoreductase ResA [Brevibacillus agri]|uniref:thiol-disulfide oxidoreductase ResA n=1 Tax=Brevibacillus agri TaxID=51101 RepID=UPI002E233D77|nr:thiol-disulfide oxidoreductase ResA [Brevibacillus agri]MED1646629.1 thiol-disulfide oxidoreductase ResA [Brevibacillus agri]MED1688159.1 thiol-disulfide oxidoreductase ResA [Brevibacillus agri]MED1699066.1 thiol-disulfide oxidoreductase ResA [Brevibacillus agri]MED1705511.1 thiol-disulfide oxidoreductase ResA [Brevibacillus agri]
MRSFWNYAFVIFALGFAIYSSAFKEEGPEVGKEAPNFSLKQLDDDTFKKLSDYRGKAVVLNFWGSWCIPCKTEMPALEKQYERFKEKGLVVIGINIGESPIVVKPFVQSVGATFPIWLESERIVTQLYRISPIPHTYFIDKDGIIRDQFIGEMTETIMLNKIQKILP